MPGLIGKTIGRYKILDQLGQGGMATVYKARDTRLEREVAIKVIRTDLFGQAVIERILKRFEREAKALARLTHPNIVPIIDYGEQDGSPYLVMALISGGTLKHALEQRMRAGSGPFSFPEAARLLAPIARSLDYAHKEGVLHRDVKPSNILITKSGEVMLTDFGIARMMDEVEGATLTGTGVGVGTPEYMAPEQWLGKADPASDQYSLGIVFYELVTGHKPYIADTPAAVLLKQATEPLPRPRSYVKNLPDDVERVLLKALTKKPEDRYIDMAAFANALASLAEGAVPGVPRKTDMSKEAVTPVVPVIPRVKKTSAFSASTETLDQLLARPPVPSEKATRVTKPAKRWLFWAGGAVLLLGLVIGIITPGMMRGNEQSISSTITAVIFADKAQQTAQAETELSNQLGNTRTAIAGQKAQTETAAQSKTSLALEIVHSKTAAAAAWTPTPAWTTIPTSTPTPVPEAGATRVREKDGMVEVYVSAGSFRMGSDDGSAFEKPVHEVYLDDYWIDQTEVTNAMYAKCVAGGECSVPSYNGSYTRDSYYGNSLYSDYPVIYMRWQQANDYCGWAGGRLPTEAEWEKAGRGDDGRTYPWGNEFDGTKANFCDENCPFDLKNSNYDDGYADTAPVGSYAAGASPYGALDMAGNVWEWTGSLYKPYPYDPNDGREDLNSSGNRVLRGGSRSDRSYYLRSVYRRYFGPGLTYSFIGFRCLFPD